VSAVSAENADMMGIIIKSLCEGVCTHMSIAGKTAFYFIQIIIPIIIMMSILTGCTKGGTPPTPSPSGQPTAKPKPIVNFYLENSGSMDGYVNGATDFQRAVSKYSGDVEFSGIIEAMNFFYINDRIIPYGKSSGDFFAKLTPATFRERGGNRGETDISTVLKNILDKMDERTVSIFVSDCIFSPGKGEDADRYLESQRVVIGTNISRFIQNYPGTAVTIYRLNSQFNGCYYNRNNECTKINDRLPYFIWLIGDVDYITALQEKIPHGSFDGGGITNSYTLLPAASSLNVL